MNEYILFKGFRSNDGVVGEKQPFFKQIFVKSTIYKICTQGRIQGGGAKGGKISRGKCPPPRLSKRKPKRRKKGEYWKNM